MGLAWLGFRFGLGRKAVVLAWLGFGFGLGRKVRPWSQAWLDWGQLVSSGVEGWLPSTYSTRLFPKIQVEGPPKIPEQSKCTCLVRKLQDLAHT